MTDGRTMIVYGDGQRVVLNDEQIDRFFELGERREDPDALAVARAVAKIDSQE